MLAAYTFNTEYRPELTPHRPSLRLLEGGRFQPGDYAPVLVEEQGSLRLRFFRWGLQPRWDQPARRMPHLGFAPAEQLFQQPAYQRPVRQQRCLIPVDGYYARLGGKGQAYKVARPDGQTFCLGGIFDTYQQADGSLLQAFALVTAPAPAALRPLGLQMPLVLTAAQETSWIQSNAPLPQIQHLSFHPAHHLLRGYPLHELTLTSKDAFEQVAA
ncbi:MAG: hypothetical protein D6722_22305 [Bacteroidetes bacterium]|nr:MAG: hypothetical protein D6722_22305 [Bacteroidota bacterium]